ncbi:hypothetical protein ACFWP2_10215 [Kitasatospora sp. NPDC058444]|uniref:hypothetical protein n=1 Tax=Kitasatospora sp. NPDC058444 TaxID=3346504 RepID=UPI00365E59CC
MTIHPLPGHGVRQPASGHEPYHRGPHHREPHHREPRRQLPFPSGFGPVPFPAPAPTPADHDAPPEAAA